MTQADARVQGVLKAASADIENALSGNPRALNLYKQGDKIWAERSNFYQEITKNLTGGAGREASAYDVGRNVEAMMKRDPERFMRMMGEMTDAEAADIRATAAQRLGQNGKEAFSLPIFVSNLSADKGIMNPRTIRALFGKDGAEALNDLRIISKAKVEADSMTNYSRTANGLGGKIDGAKRAVWGVMGLTQGGPAGAVAADMTRSFLTKWGEDRAARMLLNPDFTKFLRNVPNTTNPKVIDAYFNRLGKITTIAANDNVAFTSAIKDVFRAMGQSPGRAAAEDQNKN